MKQAQDYSLVYGKIRKEVVEATRQLIQAGMWNSKLSDQDKFIDMGLWVQRVASIYEIVVPKIYFVGGQEGELLYESTGGGIYYPDIQTIFIYKKLSLTTLAHEFRHHMQNQNTIKLFRNDVEHDAKAWSLSLYRLSAPDLYKRAKEKGLLKV